MPVKRKIYPILLAGGIGTRLWPVSRASFPKQFKKLFGGKHSFFQKTLLRLVEFPDINFEDPIIFTSEDYRFIVLEQLQEIQVNAKAIILEPKALNTAPTIFASTLFLKEEDPDALMFILPTDHKMEGGKNFFSCISSAAKFNDPSSIFVFGVKPTRAETGYGYLKLAEESVSGVFKVKSFTEKPNLATAEKMVSQEIFYWNAGIFLAPIGHLTNLFNKNQPQLVKNVKSAVSDCSVDLDFIRLKKESWDLTKPISFDYAIMEKARKVFAVIFDGFWSDMGNWDAVWRENNNNINQNFKIGSVNQIDCSNSLLITEDKKELVALGLTDIAVISSNDAVLVIDRKRSNEVKDLVGILQEKKIRASQSFDRIYRPWGYFETLEKSHSYHVKTIVVNPGQRLSLQSHNHRSEHWVVVEGEAVVIIGEEQKKVKENESVYIPLGEKHRLENKQKRSLVLIEVQTGKYLEEDDIIRYEDDYSRNVEKNKNN